MMALFNPSDTGEINTVGNREFIRGFMQDMVGETELPRYVTAEGHLTQEGVNRIRNAVFHKAYGSAEALTLLSESTDNNIRNVMSAMIKVSGRFAALQDGIDKGVNYDVNIAQDVAQAANKLSTLRDSSRSLQDFISQQTLFGKELTPIAEDILSVLDEYKRSPATLSRIFATYIDKVETLGNPKQGDLLGERKTPDKAEILKGALAEAVRQDTAQTSMFEQKTENDNAKFDAAFAKVAGDVWTGRNIPTRAIPISHTPEVLLMVGAKKLPLTIAPDVIRKAGQGKHKLPFEVIERLPAELRDPLMVFDSATVDNSLVVLTGTEHEGKPIIASILLEKREGRYLVNSITSIHDKAIGAVEKWIKGGLLKYWDEERAKGWLQSAGLTVATSEGAIPSSKTILSKTDFVKYEQEHKGADARGRITFGPEGVNITLLKNADRSTFIHETGHFYLKVNDNYFTFTDNRSPITDNRLH